MNNNPRLGDSPLIVRCPSVKKAFDDFFAKRAEPVLETAGSQCLVVKV
jgi:hypothetical protein